MRTTWSEQELDVSRVGLPGAARMDIMEQLPCRQVNPEAFFAESPADVERAKALCGSCPLQAACLEGALGRREPWGVWGGQLFINGVVVARKRPRGRPRKNPLPEQVPTPIAPAAAAAQDRTERAA